MDDVAGPLIERVVRDERALVVRKRVVLVAADLLGGERLLPDPHRVHPAMEEAGRGTGGPFRAGRDEGLSDDVGIHAVQVRRRPGLIIEIDADGPVRIAAVREGHRQVLPRVGLHHLRGRVEGPPSARYALVP